jgi:Polyketide cyclase / dehydrase and lipid transport
MKFIRGGLFVFGGLFIIMTLISLLIPSTIMTAKSITVQCDSTKLFDAVSKLQNWKKWHPVFVADSNNIAIINNPIDKATWSSNNKVNTILVTKNAYPEFSFLLQRAGENDLENTIYVNRVEEGGNMQVQWKSVTKLKWYPWEKFGGIFIEKLSGAGYEAALASLKKYVEGN